MIKNPKIDSALHVLKGAANKVLGAKVTTGVFEDQNIGRLTLEFDRKPTDEEMALIEKKANDKISEDAPIEVFQMERREAEEKYRSIIYDKFPVPEHIKTLTIVEIKDWNVNCCIGNHVKSTSEIGRLKIRKYKFRASKNQLEIGFELCD